jgi:2-keto-4-pentenoate hydratase/2-oxohepta-3-ene-1,7-dioic acid hydratase in catechol pathway
MTTAGITRYVRYTDADGTFCGILDGDTVRQLDGYFLDNPRPTGRTVPVAGVRLEVPVDPLRTAKVFGVAGAYNRPDQPPRVVPHPRWFSKMPSALNRHEGDVDLPPHASNLNFEGELVLIIGKEATHLREEEALDCVFGVTVGNDWSENTWFGERLRGEEPSRLISKSMDTWACLYHTIVTGLDYSDLDLEIRLNGELAAKGRTSSMTNSPARLLSYITHFVTLQPGDVIYTGTVAPPSLPGIRRQMQDGDVVEVEIEGIGRLRNTVRAMRGKGHDMLWAAEQARAKTAGTEPIKAPGASFS